MLADDLAARAALFDRISALRTLAAEADIAYQAGRWVTEKACLHDDDERVRLLEGVVQAYDNAVRPDLLVKLLDEVMLDMVTQEESTPEHTGEERS